MAKFYDVDEVKSRAKGNWPSILCAISGFDANYFIEKKNGPCPLCKGTNRWNFTNMNGDGSVFCNQCPDGKKGDGFGALELLTGKPFKENIALVAEYLGLSPNPPSEKSSSEEAKKTTDDPASGLFFEEWDGGNEGRLMLWCLNIKRGVTPDAVKAIGGRYAKYFSNKSSFYRVIAIPVLGLKLDPANPVGWVLYNLDDAKGFPKNFKNPTTGMWEKEWLKIKLTKGSKKGVIADLSRLQSKEVTTLIKVEGVSDLLTGISLSDIPSNVAFITNANGAGEKPENWVVNLFAGKTTYVLHDADEPGQRGATGWLDQRNTYHLGWAQSIAPVSQEVRNLELPYPVEKNHGKDFRDFILSEKKYSDLEILAKSSRIIDKSPPVFSRVIEELSDPYRLARLNLEQYEKKRGSTLRYWRDDWYKYTKTHYRRLPDSELKAKVTIGLKKVIDELNLEAQKFVKGEEKPPSATPITTTLINSVVKSTMGLPGVLVSSSVELNTWIDQGTNERLKRRYIAFKNGILNLDEYINRNPGDSHDDIFFPHTPNWFSTTCLPYAFNPAAECPKWIHTLDTNQEKDDERIKILQEWAGYVLFPDTSHQKFLALEGEGSNGKSVYLAGIRAIVGNENCSGVALEQFSDRFSKQSMLGKLVNISADCSEIDKTAEGFIKACTSGDPVDNDRKNKESINARHTVRLMMAFNNRPRFSDRSTGIWRRMILIPWRVHFSEHDPRKVLDMDKEYFWIDNDEVSGMFNWAVAGLRRLRTQKRFTSSTLVSTLLTEYQHEMNPAREFLTDNYTTNSFGKVKSRELYSAYSKWCTERRTHPLGDKQFGKEIFRIFPNTDKQRMRVGGIRTCTYVGITARSDSDDATNQNTDDLEPVDPLLGF